MEPRRILILAPHPDDEIVACGIAALRARAAGARVFVLYLTTGVPAPEALWPWQRSGHAARLSRRRAEARVAATLFGLEPIGSLDYPSRHLRHHLDATAAEIGRAIMEHAIETLWVPAFEGARGGDAAGDDLVVGMRRQDQDAAGREDARRHAAARAVTAARQTGSRSSSSTSCQLGTCAST